MTTATNPKDAVGRLKPPLELIPGPALVSLAEAFRDGRSKYGAYNWRTRTVGASVYVGAALRHLHAWYDGEDIDPTSKVEHLAHAMACLGILLDAKAVGKLVDDRPAPAPTGALLRRSRPQ